MGHRHGKSCKNDSEHMLQVNIIQIDKNLLDSEQENFEMNTKKESEKINSPPSSSTLSSNVNQNNLALNLPNFSINKAFLKPKHSLSDWIIYKKSRINLKYNQNRMKKITGTELSKHNKLKDAWTSIRGIVYDITEYLDYHPGGLDEILRAAGKEATELFKQVHHYVNWKALLENFEIGNLVMGSDIEFAELNKMNIKNKVVNDTFFWKETLDEIELELIMNYKPIITNILLDITDEKNIKIGYKEYSNEKKFKFINFNLQNRVKKELKINILESNNLKICLYKCDRFFWNGFGEINHIDNFYRKITLFSKKKISHNTYLFEFKLPTGLIMPIKFGDYVELRIKDEISRYYTPVPVKLINGNQDNIHVKDVEYENFHNLNILKFIIKIYENGEFTSRLDKLNIEKDVIEISNPFTIDCNLKNIIETKTNIYLFAGGTGITPMLNILELARIYFKNNMLLLFYNKTEKDVILEETLTNLKNSFNFNFDFKNILTSTYNRSKAELILATKNYIPYLEHHNSFVFVCGPDFFNHIIKVHLNSEYNFNETSNNVYIFKNKYLN